MQILHWDTAQIDRVFMLGHTSVLPNSEIVVQCSVVNYGWPGIADSWSRGGVDHIFTGHWPAGQQNIG